MNNSKNNNTFLKPTDEFRNYKALEEIEKNPSISQRDLANKLGVALGIANACVHTLIKKGLIKIRGENNRSITYHLTKQGIFHKSILALEWSKNTINFYIEAKRDIKLKLIQLAQQNYKNLLLYGSNEINEIANIVSKEAGVQVTAATNFDDLLKLLEKHDFDMIVLTDKNYSHEMFNSQLKNIKTVEFNEISSNI